MQNTPSSTPKATPKEVFSYLLMIATFYASITSFIALVFQIVNKLFPDQLEFYYDGMINTVRQSAATLIVVWPVFCLLSTMAYRDILKNPEKKEYKIRKWLVYLTLFISAVAIIIDLVSLIYNFLGGEIHIRFVLKSVAVLAVAAFVFGFYFWDLKRDIAATANKARVITYAASALVIAAIIGAIIAVGTPGVQRARRMDAERITHLNIIQGEIVQFWQTKEKLPETLAQLEDSISGFKPPFDPGTNAPYEYAVKGDLKFELCATFETSSKLKEDANAAVKYPRFEPAVPYGPYGKGAENWDHDSGRICFERTIDPDFYRPFKENRAVPIKD